MNDFQMNEEGRKDTESKKCNIPVVSVSVKDLCIGNLVKLNYKDYHTLEEDGYMNDKNNIWVVNRIDE